MDMLGKNIRKDFPIFQSHHNDELPFIYLDSAATSLKPRAVIEAMNKYYEYYSANVGRGVYSLSVQATDAYERSRELVQKFIGAEKADEIVFVRNATEALNLLARCWAGAFLNEGDGILLSEMEHHANLVPWQQIAREKKLQLHFLSFDSETGQLEWKEAAFSSFLRERRIKLVSLVHLSNVLGVENPIPELAAKAHEAGAVLIADASQSVPHMPIDVQKLGADFVVFSGHKMLGPTGVGVLWGRYDLLQRMPPFLTGGEMIRDVGLKVSTFQDVPWKFEAGTPDIAGVIGLGAAVKYLQEIGMDNVHAHEKQLMNAGWDILSGISGAHCLGPQDPHDRTGVIAFTIDGIHPHDVGSFLDERGIMVRVGDHCAKPLHKKLKIPASSRISFHIYNDEEDVERCGEALKEIVQVFSQ